MAEGTEAQIPGFETLLKGEGLHEGRDPAKLLAFYAQEMQLFYSHIQQAVALYNATGELPSSAFSVKKIRNITKPGAVKEAMTGEKRKRKPSMFNMFMREKMAEYKEKNMKVPDNRQGQRNPLFSMAVEQWKSLSAKEKAAFEERMRKKMEEEEANGAGGDDDDEEDEEEEEGSEEEEEEEEESD